MIALYNENSKVVALCRATVRSARPVCCWCGPGRGGNPPRLHSVMGRGGEHARSGGGSGTVGSAASASRGEEHALKKVRRAKREIRSELRSADWTRHGYAQEGAPALVPTLDNIDRIHCRDVGVEDFIARYEKPARPVVIDGFAEGTAALGWSQESLTRKYGDIKFKCGEDDEVRAGHHCSTRGTHVCRVGLLADVHMWSSHLSCTLQAQLL
jgi:hypothetical protein